MAKYETEAFDEGAKRKLSREIVSNRDEPKRKPEEKEEASGKAGVVSLLRKAISLLEGEA